MPNANIPGLSIHYKDNGLLVPIVEGGPLTDTILVIGTALDGPVGQAVRVNASNAETLFGPLVYNQYYSVPSTSTATSGDYNNNTLIKGMYEVALGGCADILLMRVGGECANSADSILDGTTMTLRSIYPGRIYNGISAAFTSANGTMIIDQTLLAKGDSLTYTLTGKTIAQLMTEVNNDLRNRTIRVLANSTSSYTENPPTATLNSTFFLSGGTNACVGDGLTAVTDYATAIANPTSGAFSELEDTAADIVYLSGIYADDDLSGDDSGNSSIATQLASALFLAAINGFPKIGVIGLNPLLNVARSDIATHVTNCITSTAAMADANRNILKMGYIMNAAQQGASQFTASDPRTGVTVDTGRYMQVIAGPDVILSQKQLGAYIDSPAGVFAGYMSTLQPQSATTNKSLPGLEGVTYEFTNKQVNQLAGGQAYNTTDDLNGYGGAYVALRRASDGRLVVNLDNTAAVRRSDYKHAQIMRIVDAVIERIRNIGLGFIGEPNHFGTRQAFRNAIRIELDAIAESRAIAGGENIGYSFSVTANAVDTVLGRVRVELVIRPALQIRSINVTVELAPPTGA